MRFERTRGNPTALAGPRLNHSATGAEHDFTCCFTGLCHNAVSSEYDPWQVLSYTRGPDGGRNAIAVRLPCLTPPPFQEPPRACLGAKPPKVCKLLPLLDLRLSWLDRRVRRLVLCLKPWISVGGRFGADYYFWVLHDWFVSKADSYIHSCLSCTQLPSKPCFYAHSPPRQTPSPCGCPSPGPPGKAGGGG